MKEEFLVCRQICYLVFLEKNQDPTLEVKAQMI